MQSRYKIMQEMGVNNYRQLSDAPEIFLMIDEIESILGNADDKTKAKITLPLSSILMLGRAAGVRIIVTLQKPEVLPESLRAHFDARLALGQMSEAYYESITELDSDYHENSWMTDTLFPLESSDTFGTGVLRLGNNATYLTIATS